MTLNRPVALSLSLLLFACTPDATDVPEPEEARSAAGDETPAADIEEETAAPSAPSPRQEQQLLAADLIRAEWNKAENRDVCAPLAFISDAGAGGAPRRANFAGGWAVAFDLPDLRSAYGVAGPGEIDTDLAPPSEQARRLGAQWPYFTTLSDLPAPSFAGYGLSGAQAYDGGNPEGKGQQSLAYVRVGGQRCTYNVWSRISRAHLEALLDALRLVAVE